MNPFASVLSAVIAMCAIVTTPAVAQFTAHPLLASLEGDSQVFAIENGVLGGLAHNGQWPLQPALWASPTSAAQIMSPVPDFSTGRINAMSGGQQFGRWGGAAGWSSTPESHVILNPIGAASSEILAAHSGRQAGWVRYNQVQTAALWTGNGNEVVSLHPAGVEYSFAYAMTATHQGGQVDYVGVDGLHAAMWNGSAASFVDMNPPNRVLSAIKGMHGNQQVGWAYAGPGTNERAALWTGTPESYIEMHPYPTGLSELVATCGTAQVGYINSASIGVGIKAGIWFGTPDSFINLHQFLPPGTGRSIATCVEERNGVFYVGGYAAFGFYDRAVVWVGVPAPGSALALAAGMVVCGGRRRGRLQSPVA